jgi:MFS family permease
MRNGAILPHHRYAAAHDTSGNAWYVLLIITIVYALNIADRFVVNTLIEPIRRAFDLGDLGVGMLTGGAVAVFYVTASVPIAMLGDRRSRKPLLVLAIAFWSALTYLCGISRSSWQFFASRVGVGIGEAGATPISQSLLSDMFPPASRSIAFSLFSLGSAAGAAAGAWMGGLLNDRYGWRDALIFFGLFGLPLAAIVGLTISEPARGRFDVRPTREGSGLMDTLRFIGRQRALIHLFAGSSIVVFWSWGLLWWTPTFLLRTHGMSLASCAGSNPRNRGGCGDARDGLDYEDLVKKGSSISGLVRGGGDGHCRPAVIPGVLGYLGANVYRHAVAVHPGVVCLLGPLVCTRAKSRPCLDAIQNLRLDLAHRQPCQSDRRTRLDWLGL